MTARLTVASDDAHRSATTRDERVREIRNEAIRVATTTYGQGDGGTAALWLVTASVNEQLRLEGIEATV